MRTGLGILCFLASLMVSPAQAQEAFSLPKTRVHTLENTRNNEDYELYVWAPESCNPANPCTAVYMLDAEYSFGLSVLIADHLQARGQLAPLVLVGIAYPDKSPAGYRRNRTRDYTITHVPQGGYGPQYQRHSGGADAFLDTITSDIIPWVENLYPVSGSRRGLVGHSFGGLFGNYTYLTRPELFTDYLIVSPSLWYDNGEVFNLVDDADLAVGHPRQLFMSVGELEERPGIARPMVSDMLSMAARLNDRPARDTEIRTEVLENQTHASVFPLALSNGLRFLFPAED